MDADKLVLGFLAEALDVGICEGPDGQFTPTDVSVDWNEGMLYLTVNGQRVVVAVEVV